MSDLNTKEYAGTTDIHSRVLKKIAIAATSETLRIHPDQISADVFDDTSKLGLRITTPLRADDVMRCSVRPDNTIYTLTDQARETITRKTAAASQYRIGRVDLVISGLSHDKPRKELA